MNVIEAAQRLIYSKLSSNNLITSQAGIYADLAPQDTSFPYITYQCISGSPEHRHGTSGELIMVELVFLVKATSEGLDQTVASSVAELVDNTLNDVRGEEQNGWVFDCVRQSLFYLPVFENSKHYRQSGGRYVVYARPVI
jgi:hypothetical protein